MIDHLVFALGWAASVVILMVLYFVVLLFACRAGSRMDDRRHGPMRHKD